jgi:outer membrane protein assembly factor BamB
MSLRTTLALLLVALAARSTSADTWPQWRGPHANGVAAPGDYPVEFSADEGLAWTIELPGLGMSTPAVWGDKIFVTCGIDKKDSIVAYDFAGKELWRESFGEEVAGEHQNGSGSNPSPVTDGEHVIAYFKSGRIACLSPEGEVLWDESLSYDIEDLWWDLGSSPVIAGDCVIVAVMNAGDSYVAALDLKTGKERWKTPRKDQRPPESDQSYTTPQLAKIDGRDAVIIFGADYLTAHDAATGDLLWERDGFNPENEGMWRVIASPAVSEGIAIVPFGRAKFLAGVKMTSTGAEKIWERGANEREIGVDVPTPVTSGHLAYVLTDKGRIECLDLRDGESQWDGELPRNRAKYYASPVLAGDKLYCAREDGVIFVVDVKEGFKLLTEEGNDMGEKIIASPVPIHDGLLIRGVDHLFRAGAAAPKDSQTAG